MGFVHLDSSGDKKDIYSEYQKAQRGKKKSLKRDIAASRAEEAKKYVAATQSNLGRLSVADVIESALPPQLSKTFFSAENIVTKKNNKYYLPSENNFPDSDNVLPGNMWNFDAPQKNKPA